MAEGGSIEIGDGFVKITSKVDDKGIKKDADRTGDAFQETFTKAVEQGATRSRPRLLAAWRRTGAATSDGFYKGADGRWRNNENKFVASGDVTGQRFGTRLVKGVIGGLSGLVGGVSKSFTGLRGAVGPVLGPLGAIAPILSILGPMLVSTTAWLWNFGSAAVAVAPMVLLLNLQIKAITKIIAGFGPAMAAEVKPITDAFKDANKEASALAAEGLRPLAEEFVRVNFGNVRTMLSSIATDVNIVAHGFFNWANSSAGVHTLGEIMRGIQTTTSVLAPSVQRLAISFLEMLGRISDVTSAAGAGGLAGALDRVSVMFDNITEATVIDGLDRLKVAFQQINTAITRTVEFGRSVIDFYQRFRTQIQLAIDVLGVLAIVFGGPVTAAIAAAGLIIRHWDQVRALFSTAREWFSGVEGGSAILDRLKVIANDVWLALQRAFFTIRDAVAGPLRELGETLQTKLFPALGNLLVAIGPLIPILIDRLAPAIGETVAWFIRMIDFAAKVVAAVVNFALKVGAKADEVKSKFDSVRKFFADLPGKIRAGISALPGIIATTFQNMANRALYLAGYLVGRVIREIGLLPGKVRNAITSAPGIISAMFDRAVTAGRNGATRFLNGAINLIKTFPGKARSAISGVPGQIKSVFSGAGSWLTSAGSNILKGLVRGMKGAVGEAVNTAVGAAKSVIGGLKKGLGINSPSKVAEEEVGQFVMPGVTRGVKKTLPAEERKIAAMVPSVATTAAAATMSASAPTSTTSNATRVENLNVNVRGVLDPTDPVAMRRMIGAIYEELAKYERSYT